MPTRKPDSARPIVQQPAVEPTEAQVRAADLEQGNGDPGDDRERRIREAAYARSQQRGFAPGHEEEDWLEAERTVDLDAPPTRGQV